MRLATPEAPTAKIGGDETVETPYVLIDGGSKTFANDVASDSKPTTLAK